MTVRLLALTVAAGLGAFDAFAVVRLFFTSSLQLYGLTNPALAFQPTEGSYTDAAHYQVAEFPPLEAWDQTPTIDWSAGEFAYIWVRFHQEANNRRIAGVRLDHDESPEEVAYYIMDDWNGDHGAKRWDGAYSLPDAPQFKMDPQVLSAGQATGIVNRSSAVENWNLYTNVTRTALLGAVRYETNGVRGAVALTWPQDDFPLPLWETAQANWVPEPATLGALVVVCTAGGRIRVGGSRRQARSISC